MRILSIAESRVRRFTKERRSAAQHGATKARSARPELSQREVPSPHGERGKGREGRIARRCQRRIRGVGNPQQVRRQFAVGLPTQRVELRFVKERVLLETRPFGSKQRRVVLRVVEQRLEPGVPSQRRKGRAALHFVNVLRTANGRHAQQARAFGDCPILVTTTLPLLRAGSPNPGSLRRLIPTPSTSSKVVSFPRSSASRASVPRFPLNGRSR